MVITYIIKRIRNWEAWPFGILYAPLFPFWLFYIIRSRAVWFFTPSNPGITFGGLEGEPKKEMYALLPECSYPATCVVHPENSFDSILEKIADKKIAFPLIVKPEVGWQGVLIRKIETKDALRKYHTQMFDEYIIQALVTYPIEVSVFYIRHPQQARGKITGFLQKVPLHVIGNGTSTLGELVEGHPKSAGRIDKLKMKHAENWNRIPDAGEKYLLSIAANHNRGGQFIDLKEHIDEELVSVFDTYSHRINDFFYGRYDIMCESVESLKKGEQFSILEYNGCGAEPNHFYDTGYTLMGAYAEILRHWKDLYLISSFNRRQGIKPWPFLKGWHFLRQSRILFKKMQDLDHVID